jgi:hypothetical protein
MKILGFNIGGSKQPSQSAPTQPTNDNYYGFSSPFLRVGKGNLSLPYISGNYTGANGYVRYDSSNLFPNTLRQLYHTSPLHSSIINFTKNAIAGGGYEIELYDQSGPAKVKLYQFEQRHKVNKLVNALTKDALMFDTNIFLIKNDSKGNAIEFHRLPLDEIRWNRTKTRFWHCEDWSTNIGIKEYGIYKRNSPDNCGILLNIFENEDLIYPVPSYASAANWMFLDGESSFLHKSNIQNSIFPSTVFLFPKKPQSEEEKEQYIKTISHAKGAGEAGRALAFFENGKEQLPEIKTIDTSNNDKLFLQTDERTDSKICQAWSIDPILLGIRVSGKLGSGSDIQQSYKIYEKNMIMPKRAMVEESINDLLQIFDINGSFAFNNYQIIEEQIVQVANNNDLNK